MRGTANHQGNLLQAETAHHILGQFNTVNNNIVEALESRIKVENNASSAQNDILNTYPVLCSTHQGGTKSEKSQNNNRPNKHVIDKQTTSWDILPFWKKPGW